MASKHISAPADLDDDGKRLFRRLSADLRVIHSGAEVDLLLLADALRLRQRLAAVRARLAEDGPTVTGSAGQIRPHPLLSTEQNLSRDIRQAFGQLRLSPDKRPSWNVEISDTGRIVSEDPDDDEYDE